MCGKLLKGIVYPLTVKVHDVLDLVPQKECAAIYIHVSLVQLYMHVCVNACVRACACVRVCVRARTCVRVCVRARTCVRACMWVCLCLTTVRKTAILLLCKKKKRGGGGDISRVRK